MSDRDSRRFVYYDRAEAVLEHMTAAERTARQADEEVLELGFRARELGASWREIADSIGVTQQAASSRWAAPKNERGRLARRRRIDRLTELYLGRRARRAAMEHERRFLVTDVTPVLSCRSYHIRQAYLWTDPAGYTIRVRQTTGTTPEGDTLAPPATFTLKGPRLPGGSRIEIEQELPSPRDVQQMMKGANHLIEKDRYMFRDGQTSLDVDVFGGDNVGLVIAEYESSLDRVVSFAPPSWCGREVTDDPRFNNESLAAKPWSVWDSAEQEECTA